MKALCNSSTTYSQYSKNLNNRNRNVPKNKIKRKTTPSKQIPRDRSSFQTLIDSYSA